MEELLGKLRDSLSDKYDVESKLGEGGMATVFLARDVRHERRVAIKLLHEDLGAALGVERFKREIEIATSLTHPHILPLYDSGEAADSLFYVMPFIEGESLRDRLDREKMLPIDQALKLTQEVAGALDYAHRKGVIHRDIKPENILIQEGHAIVADFGIARAVSSMGTEGGSLTKTGMSLGTPTYMSPEQAFAEKDIDGRSDMYSLACVLYEMLTGEPPFTGANAQSIMARHSMAEVPSMQIVRATIPDELEDVVQRALAKNPSDRFASVKEFAEELEECVIDFHTTTRRAVGDRRTTGMRTPPGRRTSDFVATPWWKKRSTLIAAAIIAVLAGGAGWWTLGRTPRGSALNAGLDANRIAVMYFQDISSDRSLGYLADGLTENLIQRLSEVNALHVVSANGVAAFRGKDVTVDSIASAFEAGTIVRGTIESTGDNFKVRVNLVDGNTGQSFADESFEQPKANSAQAPDSLATMVATMLKKKLGPAVAVREARAGTSNTAAWIVYQKAQRALKDADAKAAGNEASAADKAYLEADSLFSNAHGLDANWTEPVIARGSLYLTRARAAPNAIEAKPWVEKGLSQIEQVLSAHPRDVSALEVRGGLRYLKWRYSSLAENPSDRNRSLDGAFTDLRTAVDIDPSRASAWAALSTIYSQKGDNSNAKIAAQTAYGADAYLRDTDRILWKLYATSYDLEQFDDAVTYCDNGGRRFPGNPEFVLCRLWLLTVKSLKPDVTRAWKDYAQLQKLTDPQDWKLTQLQARMLIAAGIARSGLRDSALKVLTGAEPDPSDDKDGELAGQEAFVRTLFGTKEDTTATFSILSRYLSGAPQHRAGFAKSQSWWWKGLRTDPRFKELVAGAR